MEEAFEKEKEQILGSLPEHIKDMFSVIGFCKHEEEDDSDDDEDNKPPAIVDDFVPCLILNPYDVPPRPVRDVYWHNLYMDHKKKKKMDQLEYLVYHYGADDPDDCYSFVAHDNFKSYETGLEAGHDSLPAHIQSKVDAGAVLTEEEQTRVRGLEEMKEDALKAPEERKRGNWPFKERHEQKADGPPAKRQKKK